MSGALGCIVGGFGSLAASYNTYRQMTGAEDLMRSARVTWFDWVMRAYFLFGIILVVIALSAIHDWNNFQPLLTVAGVVTFQAGLFLLWRFLIRPWAATGAHLATSAERDIPAEPGYLRAVVWPTLAMLGLFAVVLADVHFALPPPGAQGVSSQMRSYRQWHEAVMLTSFVVVPLCLLMLGVWRVWGPRKRDPEGRWVVPSPFAARGWMWAVAILAGLSLFLPWFRLEVLATAEAVLQTRDVLPEQSGDTSLVAFTATYDNLKHMAAMPAGWRYGFRGMQQEASTAAACLLIFGSLLSAIVLHGNRPVRVIFLLVFGGVALLLITSLLHDAADQSERIVIDRTTESGLYELASRTYGASPQSIAPWRRAVRTAFVAQPDVGVFSLIAACGLAIFIGVTEASWGLGTTLAAQNDAPRPHAETVSPKRAAALPRVAGPAIGLIVVGVLGFVPLLLAALLVPVATIPHRGAMEPHLEPLGVLDRALLPSGAILPTAGARFAAPSVAAAVWVAAPNMLAQASPPVPDRVVLWFPIVAILYLLSFTVSATLIIGGWRMRQAKSYGLSLVASVLALLPCTLGWIIGLPIGIWALLVLLDPQVKAGFDT